MHIYYITDRRQFAGGEPEQRRRVLEKIAEAARAGVDFIQLREKDLPSRHLEQLAREAVRAVRENSRTTKLLINSRLDIALACGADGVHLTSSDISASDTRAAAASSSQSAGTTAHGRIPRDEQFLVAVSTHTTADVQLAYAHGADFAVFGPVFEKVTVPARAGVGVNRLRVACTLFPATANTEPVKPPFPVLALGGVTLENAAMCIEAGAAGIAAIRLFQEGNVAEIVTSLRAIVATGSRGR